MQSEPLSLVLIDTGKDVEGTPMQTVFLFPPGIGVFGHTRLHMEQGAHEPSLAESLAPFHPDPTQRIAALYIEHATYRYLVLHVGLLLGFGNGGVSEIGWDRWKSCVTIPAVNLVQLMHSDVWVSGCRLFTITAYRLGSSSRAQMEVYDFSMEGRSKYLSDSVSKEFGGLRYLSSTGTRLPIPWGEDVLKSCGGHDSVSFHTVSVT